jgi:hypothetical protein
MNWRMSKLGTGEMPETTIRPDISKLWISDEISFAFKSLPCSRLKSTASIHLNKMNRPTGNQNEKISHLKLRISSLTQIYIMRSDAAFIYTLEGCSADNLQLSCSDL